MAQRAEQLYPGEAEVTGGGLRAAASPDIVRFGGMEVTDAEVKRLGDAALVDRLVSGGLSRLSAERIVAIERGTAEPGRARAHMQSRR